MPLGIERINARRKQPNDRITFIKPLEGPDKALAQDFLERIAAICNPIMKAHHISIMSLEEYEPNLEFVGRNFNAGEVIQLVLKAPYTGHWLPFKYVQMVMMHELAHNSQMNHSHAFWKVRNGYADELRVLWGKGYTGEGMWSRGYTLVSGQYERERLDDGEILPEHLCGGTYRSSARRKRRAKTRPTYRERQEKRIAKKFGINGVALGADEETKAKLEKGKKTAAKPRVAGSARGRELRAAAALARFEARKEEPEEEETWSETESEGDGDVTAGEAVDINGKKMLDGNGRGMVKVCDDEDRDDIDAQNEMTELRAFDIRAKDAAPKLPGSSTYKDTTHQSAHKEPSLTAAPHNGKMTQVNDTPRVKTNIQHPPQKSSKHITRSCPVCSLENDPAAATCFICSNVLDPEKVTSFWRCQSEACKGGIYINAGDCRVCGVCGARKCSIGD